MTKAKKTTPQPTGYRIYSQYILIGGAIGLYYGIFSRTSQAAPDFSVAILLAVLAGALTTLVRSWRKKPPFRTVAVDFIKSTAMFLVFLLALQLRAVIEAYAGRTMVIIFMTSIGVLFGLIMGISRKPAL
jgi:hypothetical protein